MATAEKVIYKIAMDIGGSMSRASIVNSNEVLIEDSTLVEISDFNMKLSEVEDKYCDLKIMKSGTPMCRLLRGEGVGHHPGDTLRLDFQMKKCTANAYQYNALFNIAKVLALKEPKLKEANVVIGTSLPVREFYDEALVSKLKSKLEGEYKFVFPLANREISVKLKKTDIKVTVESLIGRVLLEAEYIGKLKASPSSVFINIGKTTADIVICKYGKPDVESSFSASFAGNSFASKLQLAISRNHFDIQMNEVDHILNNPPKELVSTINRTRQEFARELSNILDQRLTLASVSKHMLDFIICGGRPFTPNIDTMSLDDCLRQHFPGVEILKVPNVELADLRGTELQLSKLNV